MDFLVALASRLEADPGDPRRSYVAHQLELVSRHGPGAVVRNPSRGFAYVHHHLVAIEEDDALTAVLACSERRDVRTQLAAVLVDDEITASRQRRLSRRTGGAQVLVSDLMPAVTGPEPLGPLLTTLQSTPGSDGGRRRCSKRCRVVLEKLDTGGPRQRSRPLIATSAPTSWRWCPTRTSPGCFRRICSGTGCGTETRTVGREEVARAVEPAGPGRAPPTYNLARFRDEFVTRYEGARGAVGRGARRRGRDRL